MLVRKSSPKDDGTGRGPGSLSPLRVGCSGVIAMGPSDTKGVPGLRGQDPTSAESQKGDAVNSTLTPGQAGCTVTLPQRLKALNKQPWNSLPNAQ